VDPSRRLADEYSAKARDYDHHWGPVIGRMAEPLFAALPLADAAHVLEVGVGTGGLVPLMRRHAPRASIVGVDNAEGMLRIAARCLPCAAMDARQLALRSSAFDVVVLVFVLFHIPEPLSALREVYRVLRPGGAIGVVTWGDDPGVPGFALWKEALDTFGAAPDPRDASVMRHDLMDTPAKVGALLQAAGFGAERSWCERFEHQWTVPALLQTQTRVGCAGRRLPSLLPAAQRACRRHVQQQLARFSDDALVHRPQVVFAVAHRPPGD
jgi:SAM-dependent methyltransferase